MRQNTVQDERALRLQRFMVKSDNARIPEDCWTKNWLSINKGSVLLYFGSKQVW